MEGEIDLEPAVLWKHLAEDVGNLRGELTILSQGPGAKILGGPAAGGSGGEAAQIEGDLAEALMKKVGDLTINNKKAATVGAGAGGKDAAASGQVLMERERRDVQCVSSAMFVDLYLSVLSSCVWLIR